MREVMREAHKEEARSQMAERTQYADRLVEAWSKKKGLDLGEKLIDLHNENPNKARNLAMVMENEEKHLAHLTETQISDTFGTTPQTIVKIIRLGYPNSVRADLFSEYAMASMKDVIYKLSPVYKKRSPWTPGGEDQLIYENGGTYFPSETERVTVALVGAQTTYTEEDQPLGITPIRPFTVKIIADGQVIGQDVGDGRIIGSEDSTLPVLLDNSANNVVSYDSGEYSVTFQAAPEGVITALEIEYAYNMERVDTNGENLFDVNGGEVELVLKGHDFRARPFPVGFSFSHMAELALEDAFSVDAQDALVQGGAEALKKSLDYIPLKMAMNASKWTAPEMFEDDFNTAGANNENDHAQAFLSAIDRAGNKMFKAMNRGGISVLVGGPDAVTYAKKLKLYSPEGRQPAVGVHLVGSVDGIPLYKAPTDLVPNNRFLGIFKNTNADSMDVPLLMGTYVPMYRTQTLEYPNMTKAGAMAYYGDMHVIERRYLVQIGLKSTSE